ncbi:MAG: TadE/TadG family type IV pilus assembly protein, partial [Pirellulaceae bacterium]
MKRNRMRPRDGKILMLTGLLMMILLGMVALAVDIGWILVARTQLQSASDSGSLAGGTELLPGLGPNAYRTPAQVQANAELQAVQ